MAPSLHVQYLLCCNNIMMVFSFRKFLPRDVAITNKEANFKTTDPSQLIPWHPIPMHKPAYYFSGLINSTRQQSLSPNTGFSFFAEATLFGVETVYPITESRDGSARQCPSIA